MHRRCQSEQAKVAATTSARFSERKAKRWTGGYVIDMSSRTRREMVINRSRWAANRLHVVAFVAFGGVVGSVAQSCAGDDPSKGRNGLGDSQIAPEGIPPGVGDAGVSVAQEAPPGTQVDAAACDDGACPDGFLCCVPCCLAGQAPVCQKAIDGRCPLPDLTVSEAALATKLSLDTVEAGACELEEQCLNGTGMRKVLRFDVSVPNRGPVDLVLGNPDAGGPFEYAACHKHYHFRNFALYTLMDDAGAAVVVGRKQAFCARDSARADREAEFAPKYDCVNQGIQKGWADIYDPTLPCQYLDVTDLPAGTYWLEVEVNPGKAITELNYDNNIAKVKVELP